jgi:hypothetical protein
MNEHSLIPEKIIKHTTILIFFFSACILNGQTDYYQYFYRIYFSDKGININLTDASYILSERAMARRQKAGITVPDFRDFPVFPGYLNQVKSFGLSLHCTSKWLNTGLFKAAEPINTDMLLTLPFVKDIKTVKSPAGKSIFTDKLDFKSVESDFPPFDQPMTMIRGHSLHNAGFDGKGILVAVLDGGFNDAEIIPSLELLRKRKGIKATRDFVTGNVNVYDYHNHGTAVLSVLAGRIDGIIRGTAPGADFMLFRTEDTADEFPVEEDFWVAAAEFADSAGADIITSSLGYGYFDDPLLDYKFTDMDGNSTFITQAADIAASKGILVFSSAGNERNKQWKRILAPSDGDSVMCIGAVDGYGAISAFSSAGPSADGRIKPDNSAMGVSVTIQISPTTVARASGTSFSCPVMSGMTACLLQAVPAATNTEIIDAIHRSADRYNSPDSLYGYGIPDMTIALKKLQDTRLMFPESEFIISPNPTAGDLEIIFREQPASIRLEIYSSSGRMIYRKDFDSFAGRSLILTALNRREQGIYFVRLTTGNGVYLQKIIKINS